MSKVGTPPPCNLVKPNGLVTSINNNNNMEVALKAMVLNTLDDTYMFKLNNVFIG